MTTPLKKLESFKRDLYVNCNPTFDDREPGIIHEWANGSFDKLLGKDMHIQDYLVKFTNFDGTASHSLVITANNPKIAMAMATEYLVTERKEDFRFPFSIKPIHFEARLMQKSFSLNDFDAEGYISEVESDGDFAEK